MMELVCVAHTSYTRKAEKRRDYKGSKETKISSDTDNLPN